MIRLGREACSSLERALAREWLETNGIGGFASSTIVGLNTRRYHGLLVAALRPPVGRMVLLSKLEETLLVDGRRYELSANQYPGAIHPQGHRFMAGFRLDPFPIFTYDVNGIVVEKTVCMLHGRNATLIRYALEAGAHADVRLELRPLVAFRDYHALTRENGALNATVSLAPSSFTIQPYRSLPPLHVHHGGADVQPSGVWYRTFEYREELARGLDCVEDLFNPCICTAAFRDGGVTIVASVDPVDSNGIEALVHSESNRRASVVALGAAAAPDEAGGLLAAAADQFVAARNGGKTIVAGYHWFTDWGRDAMIALPGLTLATGRDDVAGVVLREFARHVDRGMIPNRFPDEGAPAEYTSVDATLWFFHAVQAFLAHTGDLEFVRVHLYDVLRDIVSWHLKGTRHGIRVDADGLLAAGPATQPLTWMDVKIGDWPVTPRFGKPVEVQALWYNALRFMERLAAAFADDERAREWDGLATRARRAFIRQFWNPSTGCLLDVVDGPALDDSVRPNQVIALAMPFSMVPRTRAVSILEVVERTLLTPYGLRTLAPTDSRYCGRYEGDPRRRDAAYHQGTVWPWLIGPFVAAYLRVHRTERANTQVRAWLEPLRRYACEAGLGHVPEVFDGDAPHRPGGCIAQAWSTAELIRARAALHAART